MGKAGQALKKICFTCLVCLALWSACTNKSAVPSGVLPPEEMKVVLWDMIQADKFSMTYLTKDSSVNRKTATIGLYQKIFDLHHISKEEFTRSYNYYVSRPDISKVMFDSLAAMADRKREEMYNHPGGPDDGKNKTQ